MTPGEVYLAPLTVFASSLGGRHTESYSYRVAILAKPRNGNVRVRWLAGPLAGKEARLVAKTLKPLEATK